MTVYGKTLEIKNVTEGYTKEQVEQNIEQFTEDRNEALYNLYELKRETLAFNEGGNKEGYCNLLDDTIGSLPIEEQINEIALFNRLSQYEL